MKEFLKRFPDIDGCPYRSVMNRLGDKWSLLIIVTLGDNGIMRFNELDKNIDVISQKMLAVTLRTLEEDGLVSRTVYPEIPPRVEYDLTEMGRSLLPLIENIIEWTMQHIDTTNQSRSIKQQHQSE